MMPYRIVLRTLLPALAAGVLLTPIPAASAPGAPPPRAAAAPAGTEPTPFTGDSPDVPPASEGDPAPDGDFLVTVTPASAHPGDQVTVTLARNQTAAWEITGCETTLMSASAGCASDSGDDVQERSAGLTVPADATPGPTSITWTLHYRRPLLKFDASPGEPEALGGFTKTRSTAFTVIGPPVVSPPDPDPSTPTPSLPGDDVSPPIGLPAIPPQHPVSDSSDHGSLPIGIPMVIVAFAIAALAAALILRRNRKPPPRPQDDRRVRVVPHGERGVTVTVREAPAHHTHVVRLEPRAGVTTVEVREVAR